MANYAIMRIEKRKLAAVSRIDRHNERLKNEYKSNPDIDMSRTKQNYHIIEPKGRYRKLIEDRIEQVGAKRRKDSVVMQDCFIGATPDWIKTKSRNEQEEYFRYALAFFENRIGKENIISAVVHMDEATPHMHLCFIPITKTGRLSSKEIIGGPKGLRDWQDRFYEHIAAKYPDISRGTPREATKRKHIPVFMFKQAAELYTHYDEILSAINNIGMLNNGKKKRDAIALLSRYAPDMARLKDQLKITDKYVGELEEELRSSASESQQLRDTVDRQAEELEDANTSLFALNARQRELDALISRIPQEIYDQITRQKQNYKGSDR